ncbi:uncharacterized protein WCC33_014787 [Rhinophrynus dorsalis]
MCIWRNEESTLETQRFSKTELEFRTFHPKCGEESQSGRHLLHTCRPRDSKQEKMLSADTRDTRRYSIRAPLSELLQGEECLAHTQDLEDRLRNHIDKMEHLKLCIAEALSNTSSTGFSYIQRSNAELKMSLEEHAAFLSDLNERMESLQMSTTLFLQMNTKSKLWESRQGSKRYSVRPQFCNDTQSERGWSPVWPRRNSDAASEMSCAW